MYVLAAKTLHFSGYIALQQDCLNLIFLYHIFYMVLGIFMNIIYFFESFFLDKNFCCCLKVLWGKNKGGTLCRLSLGTVGTLWTALAWWQTAEIEDQLHHCLKAREQRGLS